TFPTGTPGTVSGPTLVSIVGNVATWTETINNPTPGIFTVTASDTVTMGGVAVTRTTGDNLSGDSPSAVKTYVDAFITLSPLTATNVVNQTHTITVTVRENPGTGFVPAPDGTVVHMTLVNSGGATATFTNDGISKDFTITDGVGTVLVTLDS